MALTEAEPRTPDRPGSPADSPSDSPSGHPAGEYHRQGHEYFRQAWQVVRYLAAGGGSLLLDLALQWVFIERLGIVGWLATAASYEIALLAHFVTNHWWVFRQHRTWRDAARRLVEYHGAALAAEVLTLAVTNFLMYGPPSGTFASGAGPYLAKIAGTATAFCWTFASSFLWIWRPDRKR